MSFLEKQVENIIIHRGESRMKDVQQNFINKQLELKRIFQKWVSNSEKKCKKDLNSPLRLSDKKYKKAESILGEIQNMTTGQIDTTECWAEKLKVPFNKENCLKQVEANYKQAKSQLEEMWGNLQ
ncbi:MAG: hypothetical protein PHI90_06605, partial [Clostridia bacterium]|nr:hypothetical protein [Clostridia bacterium]